MNKEIDVIDDGMKNIIRVHFLNEREVRYFIMDSRYSYENIWDIAEKKIHNGVKETLGYHIPKHIKVLILKVSNSLIGSIYQRIYDNDIMTHHQLTLTNFESDTVGSVIAIFDPLNNIACSDKQQPSLTTQNAITAFAKGRAISLWSHEIILGDDLSENFGEIKMYTRDESKFQDIVICSTDVTSLLFSKKNAKLFVGLDDGMLGKYNLKKRKFVQEKKIHNGSITAMKAVAKHTYLITGSTDKTIKLWDNKFHNLLNVFSFDESYPTVMALSPSNKHFVAAFINGKILLWKNSYFFAVNRQNNLKRFLNEKKVPFCDIEFEFEDNKKIIF